MSAPPSAQRHPAPQTPQAHWAAEALWEELLPLLPGLSVEVLARCDSTNTRLLERARLASSGAQSSGRAPGSHLHVLAAAARGRRAGDIEPTLLVTEHQTDGRGRMGREWKASPGDSLTFSLSLPLAPRQWHGLSLAVGLALAEALEPRRAHDAPPRLQLKWPNDLWLCDAPGQGRKLGGVLIETVSLAGSSPATGSPGAPRMAVVGVGLNVRAQALQGLSSGYACMQELLPDIGAPALLHRVAAPLVRALLDFQRQGFAPLTTAYAARDLLRGQAVSTTLSELPEGVAEGVDEDGALRLRLGPTVHRVHSGEVSIRLQPPAGAAAGVAGAPPC